VREDVEGAQDITITVRVGAQACAPVGTKK